MKRRGAALLALCAGAALGFGLIPRLVPEGATVARLSDATGDLVIDVRHLDGHLLARRLRGPGPAPGFVHELWILAPQAQPVALGPVTEVAQPIPYPPPPAGWRLAVSVEPDATAPREAPRGPLILSAKVGPGNGW